MSDSLRPHELRVLTCLWTSPHRTVLFLRALGVSGQKEQGGHQNVVYFGKVQLHWENPPGGASDKEPTCRYKRHGFDPKVGKIPWRRAWPPAPVFFPGEPHGQRSLAGYSPGGREESDTTERLSTHTASLRWCVSLPGWQNKMLPTGGLNNKLIFSHFRQLAIGDQGAIRASFWWDFISRLAGSRLLPVSSLGLFSVPTNPRCPFLFF